MQELILESDFYVNYSLLSSLLEKMNSISDLYFFPFNQLVPSPTHFSHTGASSIIDLCSSQASATHWNTYQPYLFSSIHHPPSIYSYSILSSLSFLQHKIPFSSLPLPQNCGTLFHSTLEYLHPFPPLKKTYSKNFTLILHSYPWQQSISSFHLAIIYH